MFERYVSSIILTLANKYIKNLNASELRMSLWGAPRARLPPSPMPLRINHRRAGVQAAP